MTDEEKKAIEILKDREYDFDELYCTFRQSFIKPYDKSIGIILELIKKQSKEIEELKAINKKLEARKYMYNAEIGEVTAIPIDNNYISKDKIKAFIKEELPDDEICSCCKIFDVNGVELKRKLQSLLEKE